MKKKSSLSFTLVFIPFVLFLAGAIEAQELLPAIVVQPEKEIWGQPSAIVTPTAPGTVEDTLRFLPGVEVVRAGGPGQPAAVYLRGAAGEHTLVLLDGVEINDAGTPGGAFDFSSVDAGMIERIEIFKGPQSLRFGSGAIGGVINLVSKRGAGPVAVNLQGRAGSFQTNQIGGSLAKGTERWDYALGVSRFESQGISAAQPGRERDGYRRFNATATAGFRSGKNQFSFASRLLRADTDLDFAPKATPPFLAADDPNYHSKAQFFTNALHAKRAWTPHLDSSFTLARHDLALDFFDPADAANTSVFRERRSASTIKIENVNQWTADSRLKVSFGPSHRRERAVREMAMTGFFVAADYARDIYTLDLGERIDVHSRFGNFLTHQVAPGLHFASSGTKLKARYATAFKSPSLFQLYAPAFGNTDLRPERSRGAELSLNQSLPGSQMLSLTAFQYHSRDLVQFGTRYENLRATRARGFETEYAGELNARWTVEAAYTYTESKRLDDGRKLLRRPLHTWSAGSRFSFDRRWSTRLRYQGKGRRADIDPITAAPAENAGYDTLNATLEFAPTERTSLSLSVENAFDRHYQEVLGYGAPGSGVYLDLRTGL